MARDLGSNPKLTTYQLIGMSHYLLPLEVDFARLTLENSTPHSPHRVVRIK